MKHIYLNLKRFDVPVEFGGVNRLAPVADWASCIVKNTQEELKTYDPSEVEFGMYFPEVHLLNAAAAKTEGSPVQIGCQSVFRADTAVGGNFGAFTTNRPASAMVAAGCETTIIGHCEERNDKAGILAEAGVTDTDAVNRLLNQEIKCAIARGMKVLYCIIDPKIDHVVGKQFADQKFSRDIIQLAAVDRAYLCGALAAHKIQQGKVNFLVGGFDKGLADQLL